MPKQLKVGRGRGVPTGSRGSRRKSATLKVPGFSAGAEAGIGGESLGVPDDGEIPGLKRGGRAKRRK